MSRKPETRFIASIHRQLPDDLYCMKNHNTYIGGPADMWYSGKNGDLWVEYKWVHKVPLYIDLMDLKKEYSLTALQQDWLHARYKEGRNVAVVLGCEEGGIIYTALEWEHRHRSEERDVETRLAIAQWISHVTKGSYEAPVRRRKGLERVV